MDDSFGFSWVPSGALWGYFGEFIENSSGIVWEFFGTVWSPLRDTLETLSRRKYIQIATGTAEHSLGTGVSLESLRVSRGST